MLHYQFFYGFNKLGELLMISVPTVMFNFKALILIQSISNADVLHTVVLLIAIYNYCLQLLFLFTFFKCENDTF